MLVHYYDTNPNLLAGETHVEIVVERPGESRRFQVVLDVEGQAFEVCKVKL